MAEIAGPAWRPRIPARVGKGLRDRRMRDARGRRGREARRGGVIWEPHLASADARMTLRLTIIGLGGSLAEVSRSRAALQLALQGAAGAGANTTLLDLRELGLPMYNPDNEDEPPESAVRLIETCYGADGMLWSSPMYQGTISGAFKNALDW